jgi:hypothetical protein
MGLALLEESPGTFRVRGGPIDMKTDLDFEIKTIILTLDPPGGAASLPRRLYLPDPDITPGTNAISYKARIFVTETLRLDSVCQVTSPDVSCTSAAAGFMHPTRDQITSENSTKVQVTADGFYWFSVPKAYPLRERCSPRAISNRVSIGMV